MLGLVVGLPATVAVPRPYVEVIVEDPILRRIRLDARTAEPVQAGSRRAACTGCCSWRQTFCRLDTEDHAQGAGAFRNKISSQNLNIRRY